MIECPVSGAMFSCPHCNSYGYCELTNPRKECDDYYAEVGDEEDEDDL